MSFFQVNRAAQQYRWIFWAIWLTAVLLMTLVGGHVMKLIVDDHLRQTQSTERDLGNLTRVTQEHANRTFRSADQVIRFVQAAYLAQGNKLDLIALTQQGVIDTEIFNQVGIIDAKGIYALANRPLNGLLDLSDREHFKVHVAADTGELFVSKPVIGRATGKWSIQLTRRITRPNGEFAGVVVLSIDPRYFTQFYGELHLGAQGVLALYGLDGVGRARRVGQMEEFGSQAIKSQTFVRIGQGQNEGTYTSRSEVDGVERLFYFRKIPNYALVVVAGMNAEEMLADHVRARDALVLQAAMLMLLIVVLAGAMSRFIFNLRRVMASRLRAQQQAREHSDQLDAIFALSPDGFISFDALRRVRYVNPAFCQMMDLADLRLEGLDEQDFSAWLTARCVPSSAFAGFDVMRARVLAGEVDAREQIEVNTAPRRVLQLGLRCHEQGAVSQILYFRDITVESQIDAMKSEFMSTAAHELRTPMTSILGFTEVLLTQEMEPATQREFLSIVLDQSKLMASILDELLDLARIEARRGKDFRYTLVAVQKLLSDLVKALPLPPGRSTPVLQLPTEPVFVMADARKLQQAVTNVLTNAYKYSCDCTNQIVHVDVALEAGGSTPERVCIKVTDHGMGMTPEQSRQVFDRFYRADTSGKVLGTGLGMSIVKEIVDLHSGKISIDSTLGQGTCVTLCLPNHAG